MTKEVVRPYSIDSDELSDHAPRIDDLMSAKPKKVRKTNAIANF